MRTIKYGLTYKGYLYVWIEKRLYRYPAMRNKRYYGLRIISEKMISSKTYYRIGRDWVSEVQLKDLTRLVQVEPVMLNFNDEPDLPF